MMLCHLLAVPLLLLFSRNINVALGYSFGLPPGGRGNGGKTLSTEQILNPEICQSHGSQLPLRTPHNGPVPLFYGLRLLLQSLESIREAHSPSTTSNDESILDHLDKSTILRIEQPINSMDPLCWIHAQQRAMNTLRRKMQREPNSPKNNDGTLPLIYYGDAEGHVEAAALGKASPVYSDSWDPFAGNRTGKKKQDMFKECELPPGARVYGGSRFDWKYYQQIMQHNNDPIKEDSSSNRDDWDGFGGDGGGFWILPAVELRRETIQTSGSTSDEKGKKSTYVGSKIVTLSIHLHNLSPSSPEDQNPKGKETYRQGWHDAATHVMTILQELTNERSPIVPCTALPPVITISEPTRRGGDDGVSSHAFERGVTEALRQIGMSDDDKKTLRKVVLARKVDFNLGSSVSALDLLMRMKFGGHVGHLIYMNPGEDKGQTISKRGEGSIQSREFFGCTPERLFRVGGIQHDRTVMSEAVAGTRIRGLTPSADKELLHELLSSKKDMLENEITGQFIRDALLELEENGWLEKSKDNWRPYDYKDSTNQNEETRGPKQRYFVRRLRNLQHLCQSFERKISENAGVIDVSRSLLTGLHPTPAVCGECPDKALEFIRTYETDGFDRGYYAGPFGYIGRDSADIAVAIRSALVTNYDNGTSNIESSLQRPEPKRQASNRRDNDLWEAKVSVFGGAGIVDGSTVQGEWTEISQKMGVISSLWDDNNFNSTRF